MTAPTRASIARYATGALAAVLVVGAATALTVLPLAERGHDPIVVAARPPAAPSVATCSGPVLAAGRDSAQAALLADAAPQSVTQGAADASAASDRVLTAADVPGGAGAAVFTATPTGDERVDIAAAGSSTVVADDLAGFAASACTRASMESWLVVGSGATGASDLIVLANPGDVAALVTLSVFGATGETTPPAGQDLVVPAGTQRVIPIAAVALGEENPIIRVTASGAPVQASMQTSLTRVLDPGGVDQVSAVSAPTDALIVPGVPVVVPPGDAGASEVPTSVRLLAPNAAGTATVSVTGPSGTVGESQAVTLVAGVPLQVDLPGLPVGTYTVSVTATTPVTGAVWATTGFDGASDFGWFTGADELSAPTLAAVAAGPGARLTFASSREGEVTLTPQGGGAPEQIAVRADGSTTIDVGSGVYLITPGDGGVRVGVTYSGAAALAGYPVPAGDVAASVVSVYPR